MPGTSKCCQLKVFFIPLEKRGLSQHRVENEVLAFNSRVDFLRDSVDWQEARGFCPHKLMGVQGLQIFLMSGVTVTSASQILESFWNIWRQVSQRKTPFSDFPARGPDMYTLS